MKPSGVVLKQAAYSDSVCDKTSLHILSLYQLIFASVSYKEETNQTNLQEPVGHL